MLHWISRCLKSLFTGKDNQQESPEAMLVQAHEDMRQNLIKNRERAIEAITQKNRMKMMVEEGERKTSQLQVQVEQALKRGDRDLALRVMHEKIIHDKTLGETWQAYEQAVKTSDAVKTAIRYEEEQYRQQLADKLALITNWKPEQIQKAIHKALEGTSIEDASASWEQAQEKIMTAQSEAEQSSARVAARIAEVEDRGTDVEAERQLTELETKMSVQPEKSQQPAETEVESANEGSKNEENPSEDQNP